GCRHQSVAGDRSGACSHRIARRVGASIRTSRRQSGQSRTRRAFRGHAWAIPPRRAAVSRDRWCPVMAAVIDLAAARPATADEPKSEVDRALALCLTALAKIASAERAILSLESELRRKAKND